LKSLNPPYQKSAVANVILVIGLSVAALGISYAVAQYGNSLGVMLIGGMIGLSFIVAAVANPPFGFYTAIVAGFLISIIERFMNNGLTLDPFIDLMIFATYLGVLVKNRVRHESMWEKAAHPITYFFLVYILFMILEVFNPSGTSFAGNFFHIRKTIVVVVLYFISCDILRSYRSINFYFNFWIVVAALCGAYGCYQKFVGFPAFELSWIKADKIRMDILLLDDGTYRKFSTLTDPAAYGIVMAVSAIMAMVILLRVPIKWNRIKLGFGLAVLLVGHVVFRYAYGYVCDSSGVAFYILMTINELKTLLFAIFCALSLAFILVAPIYGNVTINRIRSTFEFSNDQSFEVRNQNRASIQPYIRSHPIGGGVLTAGTSGNKYNPGHYLAGFPPDSGMLRYAVETGWIGLILICAFYFFILQQGVHAFYTLRRTAGTCLFVNSHCYPFRVYHVPVFAGYRTNVPQPFLFFPLVAIIVRIIKIENKKQPQTI
jgi:putative inorganic carbon (HCO3(-)) transporter